MDVGKGNPSAILKRSFALIVVLPGLVIGAEAAPIAGLAPYERPVGAPVIKSVNMTPEARGQATRGVAQPLPSGLGFLNDQGAWYTPFTHAGMPGYYDIRGMHRSKGNSNGK
jgi:hypothetical protein